MATDYFANVAFGVVLEDDDQAAADALYRESAARLEAEGEDGAFPSEVATRMLDDNPGFLARLREKYGSGPRAVLIYTGDEDERPGRCSTAADDWILGVGLYGVIDPDATPPAKELPLAFVRISDWHTWVEAG
jgi:hypothetical protein